MCTSTSCGSSCASSLRGLLYRSKPSSEVTNVNAGAAECKASQPGHPGVASAPASPLLWAPVPALASPMGIQVSGRNTVQLRACGGADPVGSSGDSRIVARSAARGPNAELRPPANPDAISAKGLQSSNYVEVIQAERDRSSGGLLQS